MIKLNLPFWLDGPQLAKLKAAAQSWWEKVEGLLDLLAWQRDISRFKDEPESLYRLRVKFAFINAVDAGSTAGLKRILQRLGVGYVEIDERMPDRDWDVVMLRLSDSQLSLNPELLRVLIQQYGRTCRRYDFVTLTPVSLRIVAADFNDDQQTLIASL
jgi:hypothetical protein